MHKNIHDCDIGDEICFINGKWVLKVYIDEEWTWLDIDYCPFCGVNLRKDEQFGMSRV